MKLPHSFEDSNLNETVGTVSEKLLPCVKAVCFPQLIRQIPKISTILLVRMFMVRGKE